MIIQDTSPIPSKVNYPAVTDQENINNVAFDDKGLSYKESPLTSHSWKPFAMEITANSENPTIGTVVNNQAHYLQIGGLLSVMYNFEKSDGGSDGSGDYIFSLPPGFTVDTDIVPVVPTPGFTEPYALLGTARAYSDSNLIGYGFVYPCNDKGLCIRVIEGTTGSYKNVGSVDYSLSKKNVRYAFFAQIPVVI
jgi:hypothetical protein